MKGSSLSEQQESCKTTSNNEQVEVCEKPILHQWKSLSAQAQLLEEDEKKKHLDFNNQDFLTEAIRWESAKGKNVLFISCPYSSMNVNYKFPKEAGINMYILGPEESSFCKGLVEDGWAVGHIAAEFEDAQNVLNKSVNAIEQSSVRFDGIFSMHEIAIPLVAQLCEHFRLPSNSFQAAEAARNKYRTRLLCSESGIATPKFFLLKEMSQAQEATQRVGFPAVLKPQRGGGSFGVVKVENIEEIEDHYLKNKALMESSLCLNWNPGCEDGDILVEEYMEGDEFDIDCLFWDGECVFASVSDNWPVQEPYFNETGSNCPSDFPEDVQRSLKNYAIDCVKALGFKQGCFHVECKNTPSGPFLIECNPRMGGGSCNEYQEDVYGVSLFANFLLCSLGIPINPPRSPQPLLFSADMSINAPKTGYIKDAGFLNQFENEEGVVWTKTLVKKGQRITGLDTGMPEWVGEIRTNGATCAQAVHRIHDVMSQLDIRVSRAPLEEDSADDKAEAA
eukprot:Nk52_evm31s1401 gene=Nk52_evmTU31s1401